MKLAWLCNMTPGAVSRCRGTGGGLVPPAQQAQLQAFLPAQTGEDLIHPQAAALGTGHRLADGTGQQIA